MQFTYLFTPFFPLPSNTYIACLLPYPLYLSPALAMLCAIPRTLPSVLLFVCNPFHQRTEASRCLSVSSSEGNFLSAYKEDHSHSSHVHHCKPTMTLFSHHTRGDPSPFHPRERTQQTLINSLWRRKKSEWSPKEGIRPIGPAASRGKGIKTVYALAS